ncbi:hypothetical protein OROHE_021792 [Orobanche hederae]
MEEPTRIPRSTDDFIRTISSWSLEDILNEDLYKNQVDRIPDSFESLAHYMLSYLYPLMEETRAELAAAIVGLCNAPFAEVSSLLQVEPHGVIAPSYDVQVRSWKNRRSIDGMGPYKTSPGDIVIISKGKPESMNDLVRTGWTWTLASVFKISEGTSTIFKMKQWNYMDVEDKQNKPLYVVFLTNVTTAQRIWNALLCMNQKSGLIETMLRKNDHANEACDVCYVEGDTKLHTQIEPTVLSKLNESQIQTVLASIEEMQCDHRPTVKLVWGPPGTGKTSTLSAIIFSLCKMNVRTLVCAPTDVAITDIASRVIKLVRDSFEVGCEDSVACPLGDILIFGNKEQSYMKEIFLNYRVDRLVECFAPRTGLRRCIPSVISFLEDCISQHVIHVVNELVEAKECNRADGKKPELKHLVEFIKHGFNHMVLPLKRLLLTFVTHIPRIFIDGEIVRYVVQFFSLFGPMERLVFSDELTSRDLETVLCPDLSLLLDMKTECLSVLKAFELSLLRVELPDAMSKDSIMEFCFKSSSLIFCTASSSFELHAMDIDVIKVLIIDEATQLKECESSIPLQLPGLKHAILVGDEWQLPATVISKLSEEAGFGRSLFSRLSSLGHSKHLLDMQYRMHPSISNFPNSFFYLGMMINAPNVKDKKYEMRYLQGRMFGSYSFINISDGREELDDCTQSLVNMVEVAVTVKIVRKLYKAWSASHKKLSIGVITPYAAQVRAILDKLRIENNESFTVAVKPIDGFQGRQKDVIIISTVRSNNSGSVGPWASPQRTNVALTRARHCLWILGDERTLTSSNSIWHTLIRDAKDRRCFCDADEDSGIAKTIINVKKDLDQLDDLLSGESILFKISRWKVLFSDNFKNSFGKLVSSRVRKIVINLLLKIASGWRPKAKSVNLLQNIKQFKVEGYCVVCTIDIMKESDYMQVLKVWDVLTSESVPMLLRRLDNISAMYTDDFISRCKEKCTDGNLEVPKTWPVLHEIVRFKNSSNGLNDSSRDCAFDCRSYVENSKVSESLLLMKFYSLSTGAVNHLLSDGDCGELGLPFEVTDEEREIIIFPKSSFILGRSGTGKTTILTMKLFRKIQQHHFAVEGVGSVDGYTSVIKSADKSPDVLRQLFVAVSPKLCHAVKQHVSRLKSFARGGSFQIDGGSTESDDIEEIEHIQNIPDSFVSVSSDSYPLVITFQKFLIMLDCTLGNSYFERFLVGKSNAEGYKRRLTSVEVQRIIRTREVTYDRFRHFYWLHFNEKLTRNMDPSQVFTEIISHIKGGMLLASRKLMLDRDDYVSLSDKRVSTLSANDRNTVYDLFLDYEKMKTEFFEFDLSDFVTSLHQRLHNENFPGDKMDFVYIDEVQDLTMRQLALFNYICKNVDEGYVFSGDTAQTIARGVDFRFEDIRSLFYNEFIMKNKRLEISSKMEKEQVSDMFYLCQNFRTHSGVLRLSQSVVDLLCHFFPQSIDVMPPETSFVFGEPPVVLEPGTDENALITIFGCGGNVGKVIGFGAEQVILVRDDSARKEVMSYIGHQALVLTIVECKGLEFQDVLLFNFFGSSPLKGQWRIIYEFMKEKDLFDSVFSQSIPSFNQSKHGIMCSELKQLYVAITRTRQRLWICENIEELSRPMLDYWKKLGLVNVRKIDDSLAQAMQRASSLEEWKSQGIKLFWEKNYEMAIMCFERAGEGVWEKRARAASLRASACHIRGSNPKEAHIMLREAAELLYSAGKTHSAADYYCDLEEYEKAGKIYLEKGGESALKKAGECFTLARRYELAAEAYAQGNYFEECLSACNNGEYFEIGLQYIDSWKQHQPSPNTERFKDLDRVVQEFLEGCALKSYRANDKVSFMKFVRAFNSAERRRNFMRSLDCLEELLLLEQESNNLIGAAEIAKMMGNVSLEVNLLGKAGRFRDSTLLALAHILSCSLWGSGNKGSGWPLKPFPEKEELKRKALHFAGIELGTFYEFVCAELKLLSHDKCVSMFELLQSLNASKIYKSVSAKIISIRKLLDAHLETHPTKYEWEYGLPTDPKRHSEERMSSNKVSVGTLYHVWDLLRVNILPVVESFEKEELGEFWLDYFGVRKIVPDDNPSTSSYLLLYPEAEWVKNIDAQFLKHQRDMVKIVGARHLVSAFRAYWVREFQTIGIRVLETLADLHKFSQTKNLPLYCRSACLHCIFEITRFFLESNSVVCKNAPTIKLQSFLDLSLKYFEIVFPSDSQPSLSGNMISLRGTQASRRLLEQVIVRDITSTQEALTSGQIGRIVMIWLGSGRLTSGVLQMIFARCADSSWKDFLFALNNDSTSVSRANDPMIFNFLKALANTYAADLMVKDYISPNCFLYLMERLVLLTSHEYQPLFFTTKSMFLEWFMYQADQNAVGRVNKKSLYSRGVFDIVVSIISKLLCHGDSTLRWIHRSNLELKYFSTMVIRSIVILCVVCLNCRSYSRELFELISLEHVSSRLPEGFFEAIRTKANGDVTVDDVARVLKSIDDPLVIVTSGESSESGGITCSDAVTLVITPPCCKKNILEILEGWIRGNSRTRILAPGDAQCTQLPRSNSSTGIPASGDTQCPDSAVPRSLGFELSVLKNWRVLEKLAYLLESEENRKKKDEWYLSILSEEKKAEVVELCNTLDYWLSSFAGENCTYGLKVIPEGFEDHFSLVSDVATNAIEQLKQLSTLMNKSNLKAKDIVKIKKVIKSLKPKVLSFMPNVIGGRVNNDSSIADDDASSSQPNRTSGKGNGNKKKSGRRKN